MPSFKAAARAVAAFSGSKKRKSRGSTKASKKSKKSNDLDGLLNYFPRVTYRGKAKKKKTEQWEKWENTRYFLSERVTFLKWQDFEYDEEREKDLRMKAKHDDSLATLCKDLTVNILEPFDLRLLKKRDMLYLVGHGAYCQMYLAHDQTTGELIAVKTCKSRVATDAKCLKEMAYFSKGQNILAQDKDFIASTFAGFLKVKRDSALNKDHYNLMPVISLAQMEDVSVCFPLDTAIEQLRTSEMIITKEEWVDIMIAVVKGAKLLNEGGIWHFDYYACNICLLYQDKKYRLSVMDFGAAENAVKDRKAPFIRDITEALRTIRRIAEHFGMVNIMSYIDGVLSLNISFTLESILPDVKTRLNNDMQLKQYSYPKK